MRPIIGIATSVADGEGSTRQVVDVRYGQALERVGAIPLLLPLGCGAQVAVAAAGVIHGLLLTGGAGITDGLVGELPADLGAEKELRRHAELALYEAATARCLPILGICYGMQFLNARHGGTIYADAMAQAGVEPHAPGRRQGQPVQHSVDTAAGTWLARATGTGAGVEVNSFHIQAVCEVGEGLTVSARSADGLIEAVETADGSALGDKWHPERMPGSPWDGVFAHLVARARISAAG